MNVTRFIPSLEKYIGIGSYLIKTYPAGGKIKVSPDDFEVEEIVNIKINNKFGKFLIIKIKKKNWDTIKLINYIAKSCKLNPNQISYCGIKDKKATAIQYLCIETSDISIIEKIREIKDIEVLDYFFSDEKLWIGKLIGNKFKIKITDIKNINNFENACREVSKYGFLNYYGIQRFGTTRPNTHLIGRLLLQQAYEEAFIELVERSYPEEQEITKYYRNLAKNKEYEKFLKEAPSWLFFEKLIIRNYLKYKNYKKAFRKLPYDYRCLFFHAYQSYLFNRALTLYSEFNKIPEYIIISEKDPICKYIMEEDGVSFKNARKLGINLKPIKRKSIVSPEAFKYKILNNKSAVLEFILPRGSYATSLIREICKGKYW